MLPTWRCTTTKVILKEEVREDTHTTTTLSKNVVFKVSEIIVFPCLKSSKLYSLQSLEGFSLGKEDFTLPSLDTFKLRKCPELEIKVFTEGLSITLEQILVETDFGYFNVGEDINSFIMAKKQEGFSFGEVDQSSTSEDDI